MVNNKDGSRGKVNMTKQYQGQYNALLDNLHRLEADQKYYNHLQHAKDKLTAAEGRNGLKATTIQIARQKQFIQSAIQSYQRAYSRGEITKFW